MTEKHYAILILWAFVTFVIFPLLAKWIDKDADIETVCFICLMLELFVIVVTFVLAAVAWAISVLMG